MKNNNFEEYKKELQKVIYDYLDKEREIIKDMTPEEEREYIKKNKKEEEIKKIYADLQKKYNINFNEVK